ncbi:hypothetical protein EZV62_005606 [Acer yangbiense]|uniref:Cyclic nucleotide-binding domain-containing protein n=1 Tax=Acer yangbiense TaxID=1000413 RepID=A0A5C7IN34_9ROSI|nr:hypothetical protein EZV62_005606 [Acer yangbiense]
MGTNSVSKNELPTKKLNTVFLFWIISITVDPLLYYAIGIRNKTYEINGLLIFFLLVFYTVFILFRICCLVACPCSKRLCVFVLGQSCWDILAYLRMMIFLVLFISDSRTTAFRIAVILVTIFLIFYSTRIFQIYRLFTGKAKRITGQIVINLVLYLYGGHLFGGIWYAFAVRKRMDWSDAYRNCVISQAGKNITKLPEMLGGLNGVCQNETDSKSNEWGIFKDAFESGILEVNKSLPEKLLYCFRWGLQNLSGFGQNLEPSSSFLENAFVIVIAIYGVVMFTFFIGNMQMYIKDATKKWKEKKREKEEKKQEILEKWFPFRKLSEKLQKCIKEHQLKNKWKLKGDVDVENLLSNLPTDLGNSIKRELCLDFLQNVGRFRSWNEVSLVHVCDRLKPVVYAKRANIVRKGKPIDEMSIVLQGKLCTFSSKDTGSSSNVSRESRKDLLKEGDFCGEELVNWVQDEPSSSKKLISNRTIKALTKVEALVLRTDDLKDIYNQKAKVIQAFLRKRRIMISGRNGQTPPGELTAPEIVVEGINSSVLEIVVESGVECDEDEDEEKGFLSHFNSRFFS